MYPTLIRYTNVPYNRDLFVDVKNRHFKPIGGLYACDGDEWKEWCSENMPDFLGTLREEIEISDSARILRFDVPSDVYSLNVRKYINFGSIASRVFDFEKIKEDYDVVFFSEFVIRHFSYNDPGFVWLYGYDVAQYLILNADVIVS